MFKYHRWIYKEWSLIKVSKVRTLKPLQTFNNNNKILQERQEM